MDAIRFKVFRFVITRFGTLRGVWALTQGFDVGLGALTVLTAPGVFLSVAKIKREVGSWPDVKKMRHPLLRRTAQCHDFGERLRLQPSHSDFDTVDTCSFVRSKELDCSIASKRGGGSGPEA
jgi:hypothetical protein